MKILFYLPLARRWMFDNVIGPMIAKLSTVADVHVMLPSNWMERCSPASALPAMSWCREVKWHLLDLDRSELDALDADGPTADILAAVHAISPNCCLCRSADRTLPGIFPGQVKYIMEASAPPFTVPKHWIALQPQIFSHGQMPDLTTDQRNRLIDLILPTWTAIERVYPFDASWKSRNHLPAEAKVLALPLEYDHPDNLFSLHRSIRPNHRFVATLADQLDSPLYLAITDHPLNEKFVENSQLATVLSTRKQSARLLTSDPVAGGSTIRLAQHADGMIVGDSKSFSAAAFFGTPIMRKSKFETGSWLRAYDDFNRFAEALLTSRYEIPDRDDAMIWFAHYLANQIFAPLDDEVSGLEILSRIECSVRPEQWSAWFGRLK